MDYFRFICHRIPERSFFIGKYQFPVCSRCTGFYIAGFSYFAYAYSNFVDYNFTLITIAFLLLVPAFVDGTTQYLGYRESNNTLRFITGLMGGLGLAIILKAFKYYLYMVW